MLQQYLDYYLVSGLPHEHRTPLVQLPQSILFKASLQFVCAIQSELYMVDLQSNALLMKHLFANRIKNCICFRNLSRLTPPPCRIPLI